MREATKDEHWPEDQAEQTGNRCGGEVHPRRLGCQVRQQSIGKRQRGGRDQPHRHQPSDVPQTQAGPRPSLRSFGNRNHACP